MTVRVRYRANDLSEGAVERFPEANQWDENDDGALELRWRWRDDDGTWHYVVTGTIRPGTWDSAVVELDGDAATQIGGD